MNYEVKIGKIEISQFQNELGKDLWPEFMQHDKIVNHYWENLYSYFLDFQFALLEKQEIVGIGNTVHLNWNKNYQDLPDKGIDWAMHKASIDFKKDIKSNILIGIQILINPKYQSISLSYKMLNIMKDVAKSHNIKTIALPVRPSIKSHYPFIKMHEYIKWKDKEGLPFDPWLRVHIKEGGKIVGICNKSMHISGTITEWEAWTGMKFPATGEYIVEKALNPVTINIEHNNGSYIEPNVWVIHQL